MKRLIWKTRMKTEGKIHGMFLPGGFHYGHALDAGEANNN